MSRCRSCDAEIVWAKHDETGKLMPFDASSVAYGKWVLDDEDGGEGLTGYAPDLVYYAATNEPASMRFTSHFETCPNAARHRSRA